MSKKPKTVVSLVSTQLSKELINSKLSKKFKVFNRKLLELVKLLVQGNIIQN